MPTKSATPLEKHYDCEVKRRRLRSNGPGYEPFWKIKTVVDLVMDNDQEFRCKHCHGALKLQKRQTAAGPVAYVEHKSRIDAEHCAGSQNILNATDGRLPRLSAAPVQ